MKNIFVVAGIASCLSAGLSMEAMAGGLSLPVDPVIPEPPAVENPWYVSGFIGASSLRDPETVPNFTSNFDTGFLAGVAVGRHVGPSWRLEGELSYANYDATGGTSDDVGSIAGGLTSSTDLDATYLMLNAWYDIPTEQKFQFYVGGGIGLAQVNSATSFSSGQSLASNGDTELAGQFGAGVAFPIGERLVMDAGYRFKVIHDAELGGAYNASSLQSHNMQLGLRYEF